MERQVEEAITHHVDTARRSGKTEVTLHLDPPELGRVHIHLVASEDKVSAQVIVQEAQAKHLLESQLDQLKQRLGQAGVTLGQFNVSQHSQRERNSRSREDEEDRGPSPLPGIPSPAKRQRQPEAGLVDLKA